MEHAGIHGNERADIVASRALIIGISSMGRTDVQRAIKDTLMTREIDTEETTRSRLY